MRSRRLARDEVEKTYAAGGHEPDWVRFADPWKSYAPEEIGKRQLRWAEEALGEEAESSTSRARRTYGRDRRSRIRRQARSQRLYVPAVWPLEFSNALWQLQHRRLLAVSQVDTIIDLAELLDIAVHRDVAPPRHWLALARKHALTSYDASYLDLALTVRYPVDCRDGTLKNALRAAGVKLA